MLRCSLLVQMAKCYLLKLITLKLGKEWNMLQLKALPNLLAFPISIANKLKEFWITAPLDLFVTRYLPVKPFKI